MGMQYAPVDSVERDLAAAQLDDIGHGNEGRPWIALKDIVLRWHLEAVARARAEAWVPGLARSPDPVVEEALNRFYRHHMRVAMGHLKAENCAHIAFVNRPFMGRPSRSLQFFNGNGEAMFKVFVRRDKERNLLDEQVQLFDALCGGLAGR